eukprot:TRINITY_DN60409_c0_g1_i4.p1 TRINITY_DN60409_c0_g1~~TRINITY_DN60409_c0_g1_i4.p1  ORF type:complete len:419 (+),score=49.88 TRINITY_DN60409_c0_g1_i4:197-1453(+)
MVILCVTNTRCCFFQTNGLTERMNASVKCGLRKLKERKGDWPKFLNQVLRGMRWHTPRSTTFSPYELAFGCKPRIDCSIEDEDELDLAAAEILQGNDTQKDKAAAADSQDCKASSQQHMHQRAHENIQAEQQKYRKRYDEKREIPLFKEGERVLLQNTRKRSRKGEELDPHFSGPYVITRITNVNTAYLDGAKRAVSVSRLKHLAKAGEAPKKKRVVRPEEVQYQFRAPDEQEMKTMATLLGLPEDSWKNRPKFETQKQFSSFSPPKSTTTYKTKGDGNCLFRSFSYFVTGDETNPPAVRRGITEYMKSDPSGIFRCILQEDPEQYLSRGMDTPATPGKASRPHWGTDFEISAFATLCKCTVFVWKNQDDSNVPEYWVPYEPLNPPGTRNTRSKENVSTGISCLLHSPPAHFDVVLDV